MNEYTKLVNWSLGLLGAIAGGAAGYLAFLALARLGLYALVVPGALVGIGCGMLSRGKSNLLGVVCGLLGALLGVVAEWKSFPFVEDGSFWFFVVHLNDLSTATIIMIAAGGLFAFWFGKGRDQPIAPRHTADYNASNESTARSSTP